MKTSRPSLNPFPGLRPFRQDEDYLFFGREEQTMELLQRLGNHRFVAVVGTSGSGKSSLVRCGLLSELLGGKLLRAGAAWEVAVTHPGGNPLALLAESLLEADLYDRDQESAREQLLATLSRSHFGLVEAIRQARLGEGTNFLLVVDQFEEIFRFHEAGQTQQEAANEYVSLLLESVAQSEVPIYVVLTMRSDFIGDCGQFEGLAEMVNRGEFLIPRLTREQYKRVIEAPIKVAGGQIAPRLLQRLLNDLGQQADQLPCLQHALMRTWTVWAERGESNELDLDDYQRVGKMSQALSLHADEVYQSLADDRQRELCGRMFQALTVQESESRGIRRPQRLGTLCRILEVSAQELVPIIEAYRHPGVTFLMPPDDIPLTDATIVDISHESLMRVWVRLRRWVDEEAQAVGIYRRLTESATLHSEGKAGLYRDPELGIALAWESDRRPNQAWAERYHPGFPLAMRFLEQSQQARLADERASEEARQHELDQARKLAEAERQRAELEQRSARRLRSLAGSMAVVALIAVGASLVAANLWVTAEGAKQTAQLSEQSARQSAQAAQDSALAAQREAERATAQELLAQTARRDAEDNLTRARAAIDEFLVQVSDSKLLSTPGLQPLRADLLESASKFYADFLTKNPDDPLLQAGLADAFYRVGFVNGDLGRHEQALAALEKAIDLHQAALRARPTDADVRHRLAKAWYQCSISRMLSSDYLGCSGAARQAARLWDALHREHPKNIDYSKSLARACNILGISTGDSERAYLAFQRSMQIRFELLEHHPEDVELVHGLGESFNNIGRLVTDADQRLRLSERAIEYGTVAHRLSPQNVEYAMDLAISHHVLGSRLMAMSQRDRALETWRNGIEHTLRFIRANPAVPVMRDQLTTLLSYLRAYSFDAVLADDYAAIFRAVRATFAELPRQNAEDHLLWAQVQSDCAQQLYRARRTFQNRALTSQDETDLAGWRAGSLAALRDAIALGFKDAARLKQDPLLADVRGQSGFTQLLDQLQTPAPTVAAAGAAPRAEDKVGNARVKLVQERAAGLLSFGIAETWLNQTDRAAESLTQALALQETLVAADPNSIPRLADLTEVRAAQARLHQTLGQLAQARDVYLRGITQMERAIGRASAPSSDPNTMTGVKTLAAFRRDYADMLAESGLWEEAAGQYAKSIQENLRYKALLREKQPSALLTTEQDYEDILAPLPSLLESAGQSYTDACKQTLAKYLKTTNGEQAARVARLCALQPNAVADLAPVLTLADKARYSWHAYTRGLVQYRMGRFDEAVSTIETARQRRELVGFGVEDFVLAMAHFRARRVDQARAILSAANAKTPRNMIDWTRYSYNMVDVDWVVLRREANQLLGSPDVDDRQRRGVAYARLKELDKALAELTAVLAARPDDALARWTLAQVLHGLGRKEPALAALSAARRLLDGKRDASAGDVELWRLAADTYRQFEQRDQAALALRKAVDVQTLLVVQQPQLYSARRLLLTLSDELAQALQADGRDAEAKEVRSRLDSLLAVFEMAPRVATATDLFDDSKSEGASNPDLLAAVDRLLEGNDASTGDSVGGSLRATLHHRRAAILRNVSGSPEQIAAELSTARSAFEQLLKDDPQNLGLARNLANVLLEVAEPKWSTLQPTAAVSEGGAKLTRLPDDSILASGKVPDLETYTVTATPAVKTIAALRLEALTDVSLPADGPGRYGNGVFQLSELELFPGSGDRLDASKSPVFDRSAATIPVDGSGIANAIDRNPTTFWSIYPGSGRPQAAVLRLMQPLQLSDGTGITVKLSFQDRQYRGASLGRFRLSVADGTAPYDRESERFAVWKVVDPWARLGAAYALLDEPGKAVDYLVAALQRTSDASKRTELARQMVSQIVNPKVMDELIRREHDQPALHLELAKHTSERNQPQVAAGLVAKARELLERQLTSDPENAGSLSALADVLLESAQPTWKVLTPTEAKSKAGATLARLEDHSILAKGDNQASDVYSLGFGNLPPRISAVRLEVLPDASLPNQGPGRSFNGNFVLTEFVATLHTGERKTELVLKQATATHEQVESGNPPIRYPISAAIDKSQQGGGGWALLPRTGQAHTAVFELNEPMTAGPGSTLSISLVQAFAGHTIGRFRISATGDENAYQHAAARSIANPVAKLTAAHLVGGDPKRAAELLTRVPARAKDALIAGLSSGFAIDKLLEQLKQQAPAVYAGVLPDVAPAAADRGRFEIARALFTELAKSEPTKTLWSDRLAQLEPGVLALWNFDAGLNGWSSPGGAALSTRQGVLTIRSTGDNPQVSALASGPAGAKVLVVRYRATRATAISLLWSDPAGGFSDTRRLECPVPASATDWKEIRLPFTCAEAMRSLRLQPKADAANPLEIDSLVLRQLGREEYVQLATQVLVEPELERLTKAATSDPATAATHVARGTLLCQLGRWKEAAEAFEHARKANPKERIGWFREANCRLLAADAEGHRQLCRAMVEQFRDTTDPQFADSLCKSCLLAPGSVDLADLPVSFFRTATNDPKNQNLRHWFLACCSLIAYREGNHSQAIEWANKHEQPTWNSGALALVVRAMAEHQLGQIDQARATLTQVETTIPTDLRTLGGKDYAGSLPAPAAVVAHDWLAPEILRREAVALINGATKSKP